MAKPPVRLLVGLIVLLIICAGGFVFVSNQSKDQSSKTTSSSKQTKPNSTPPGAITAKPNDYSNKSITVSGFIIVEGDKYYAIAPEKAGKPLLLDFSKTTINPADYVSQVATVAPSAKDKPPAAPSAAAQAPKQVTLTGTVKVQAGQATFVVSSIKSNK